MPDISFTINGKRVRVGEADQNTHLLEYLQEDMGLTGTKFGCGIGVCQACTVAVRQKKDGPLLPVVTCVTPLVAVQNMELFTIESVAENNELHPIQTMFLEEFSFQCGYCTPGFVMASLVLWENLKQKPIPRSKLNDSIAEALGEHICRCTGYVRYHQALRKVILEHPELTVA